MDGGRNRFISGLTFGECVDVGEGEVPWGGLDKIGSVGSFYVAVNGRPKLEESSSFGLKNITS